MKKLLLILLCLPMIFSYGENENDTGNEEKKEVKNDLTRENIKGNVKEIWITYFKAKEVFGKTQKGNLSSKVNFQYNEDGNKTEEISYNGDGELSGKKKYQYDKDGNNTEMISYNGDGKVHMKYKYQYDEDGNKTETISYKGDREIIYRTNYQYDKDGNNTEMISYKGDGELYSKFKHQYDKDGNNTETISYKGDREIDRKWKYQYIELDKLKNWIVKTYSGSLAENFYKLKTITEREIEYYE